MLENVGGYVRLGLVTAGERAHNIICKNDESTTSIRLPSVYEHESQRHDYYYTQEKINKKKDNKGIKRILIVVVCSLIPY